MVDMKNCPYRAQNFGNTNYCVISPYHFKLDDAGFDILRDGALEKRPGAEESWNRYRIVVKAVYHKCPHLDRDSLTDSSKMVAMIIDDDDSEEMKRMRKLIPDESIENFGMRCRCLYPNIYQKH